MLSMAGGNNGAFAGADLLRGQGNGAQTGAAHLVDAERGLRIRHAGAARSLPSRVLSFAGSQHLPKDHFIHVTCVDTRTLKRPLQGDGAKCVGG
jgi:hypothetical protein